MLKHLSEIKGNSIGATDGPIGFITDCLIDDVTWLARRLVVDTGEFLAGRQVLFPPSALGHVNHIGKQLSVRLTKQQVKDSPEEPVSRQKETSPYDGWRPLPVDRILYGWLRVCGGPVGNRCAWLRPPPIAIQGNRI